MLISLNIFTLNNAFSDFTLYRESDLETQKYALTFFGENSESVLAQCESILEIEDLEIGPKWKDASDSNLRARYMRKTGVNKKTPVFASPVSVICKIHRVVVLVYIF